MKATLRILLVSLSCVALASAFAPLGSRVFTRSHTFLLAKQAPTDDAEIERRVALVRAAAVASGLVPATRASAGSAPFYLENKVVALERQNKETKNTQGAPEKHLPEVTLSRKSIEVKVPHVMDAEKPHFIEFIWLQNLSYEEGTLASVAAVKAFKPSDPSPPTLTVGVASGQLKSLAGPITQGMVLKPMLYCNLHGLWEGEPVTIKTV